MKKTLFSLFAMLLAGAGSVLAQTTLDPQTIYASYNGGTLTFFSGSSQIARARVIYLDNTGNKSPFSDDVIKGTTKVVFDESCKTGRPTSTAYWFAGMYNLTSIEGMENLNTSEVTDMTQMFYNCTGLTSLDISKLDMSSVRNVSQFARGCSGLKELNLGANDLTQYNNGWNYYSTESCLYGIGGGLPNVCHLTFTFAKKISYNRSHNGYNFDGSPDQQYQLNGMYNKMIPAIYTYCGGQVVMADTIFCDQDYTPKAKSGVTFDIWLRNRNVKGSQWQTLIVPAPMLLEAIKGVNILNDVCMIESYDGKTLTFKSVPSGTTIPANTPLLIQTTQSNINLYLMDANSTEVPTSMSVSTTPVNGYYATFYGNYKMGQKLDASCYYYNYDTGLFTQSKGNSTVDNMRCYLKFFKDGQPDRAGAKAFALDKDGVITSISQIEIDGVPVGEDVGPAYNLSGQRVGDDYKGIVIVGGRKVIRK